MTQQTMAQQAERPPSLLWKYGYRAFAYFGLMTIHGSLLYGFAYNPFASAWNYAFDFGLYAVFLAPHLIMTRAAYKRATQGTPAGTPAGRRLYITITIVTWLAVLALQRPLPGGALELPPVVQFGGVVLFLLCFFLFFLGMTIPMIDGLLGVPGTVAGYSHGRETPLFTEGAYAGVRHPMYRAALLAGLASLLLHPTLAQVLWAMLLGGTFLAYIPVEERQLIAARGDDYREYMKRTPYRLLRGVW